jgi:hypothetical protein
MAPSMKAEIVIDNSDKKSTLALVLDTTEIVRLRYRLDGPHVAVIERAISLNKLDLIVLQIVVEEANNRYKEELITARDTIRDALAKLNVLPRGNSERAFIPIDIDKLVADFTAGFARRLEELRTRCPSYSDIPHADIVRRDLDRRRPFQPNGKGYRDCLFWESMLREVAPSSERTVLITENSKDFCSNTNSNDLHPDLRTDLKTRKLQDDSVGIYRTLKEFVDQNLKLLLPTTSQVLLQIQQRLYKAFDFIAFFRRNREALQEQLTREFRQSEVAGLDFEVSDPEVRYIEDPSSERIAEAYELDPKRLFLAYDVDADINAQFFVIKADYYAMSEDAEFQIEDSDWNDYYILGSKQLSLPLRISLVLEVGVPDKVESFDIELIEFYGRCWKCDAPIRNDAAETCTSCEANLLSR